MQQEQRSLLQFQIERERDRRYELEHKRPRPKPFDVLLNRLTTGMGVGCVDHQAPESTAKKAFDFNSTVDSRRLSTLV
eukprot:1180087-Prorocentrum_minimum.AAC.1